MIFPHEITYRSVSFTTNWVRGKAQQVRNEKILKKKAFVQPVDMKTDITPEGLNRHNSIKVLTDYPDADQEDEIIWEGKEFEVVSVQRWIMGNPKTDHCVLICEQKKNV